MTRRTVLAIVTTLAALAPFVPAAALASAQSAPNQQALIVSATGDGSLTPIAKPDPHTLIVSATGGGSLTPLPKPLNSVPTKIVAAQPMDTRSGSSFPDAGEWIALVILGLAGGYALGARRGRRPVAA